MTCAADLLDVRGLTKAFADGDTQRIVIANLELTLRVGEIVALWGPSGSGKSTLLNLLAGVQPADAGAIQLTCADGTVLRYGDVPLAQTQRLRRTEIGYVFQFFNLVPTLTVAENIELALQLAYGRSASAHRDAAMARAESLGLGHLLHAFPERLSGGEAQRAAIARAMAFTPRLLLADEPTGNLDAANAAQVMSAFLEQVHTNQCALVIATHDDGIAARADRIIDLT